MLEEFFTEWLNRHHAPLSFELPNNFGKIYQNKNPIRVILKKVVSNSSFLSLVWEELINQLSNIENTVENESKVNEKKNELSEIPVQLKTCLLQYKSKFNDKFILVSIINDNKKNDILAKYCQKTGIRYFSSMINIPENKIRGGHLNIAGNRKLGEFLNEIF